MRIHGHKLTLLFYRFVLPVAGCIVLVGILFGPFGIPGIPDWHWFHWHGPYPVSVGQPQTNYALSQNTEGILLAAIVANVPQVVLTYWYLGFNSIWTTMVAMAEWTRYVEGPPKGLRVSKPVAQSQQRSSYLLSVPLIWAIPSLIASALLHWLFSEMLFLVQLDIHNVNGEVRQVISTQYYSPFAMFLAVPLAAVILVVLIIVASFKRYPAGAPLAGCCSASISAACQPGQERFEEELSYTKLKWGVVDTSTTRNDIGHATFSNVDVGPLASGKLYA